MSKAVKMWIDDFCNQMDWLPIPLNRVKLSKMPRYKGLCICDGEEFYMVLSTIANKSNHDFFATVIHEIIHAQLWMNKKTAKNAHKHKADFKKMAKQVEKRTGGFYTKREIV